MITAAAESSAGREERGSRYRTSGQGYPGKHERRARRDAYEDGRERARSDRLERGHPDVVYGHDIPSGHFRHPTTVVTFCRTAQQGTSRLPIRASRRAGTPATQTSSVEMRLFAMIDV